jgi:hypothetical protein
MPDGIIVRDEDRLDMRLALIAPEAIVGDHAEMLAWAERNAPALIYSEERARLNAERRTIGEAWRELSVDEKRVAMRRHRAAGGRPTPDPPPREYWPRDPRAQT